MYVSHVKVACNPVKLKAVLAIIRLFQPFGTMASAVANPSMATSRGLHPYLGDKQGNHHKSRVWFPPVICSSFIGTEPFQELRRWCMHSGLMVCTAALQTRGQVWVTTKACTLPYCPSTTCILMATRLVLSWHLHHQFRQSSGEQT